MKKESKSFVLMNKNTGDLFEGYRIGLFDQPWLEDIGVPVALVSIVQHDGWIMVHPEFPFPVFMNRHSEKWFVNLGEL